MYMNIRRRDPSGDFVGCGGVARGDWADPHSKEQAGFINRAYFADQPLPIFYNPTTYLPYKKPRRGLGPLPNIGKDSQNTARIRSRGKNRDD